MSPNPHSYPDFLFDASDSLKTDTVLHIWETVLESGGNVENVETDDALEALFFYAVAEAELIPVYESGSKGKLWVDPGGWLRDVIGRFAGPRQEPGKDEKKSQVKSTAKTPNMPPPPPKAVGPEPEKPKGVAGNVKRGMDVFKRVLENNEIEPYGMYRAGMGWLSLCVAGPFLGGREGGEKIADAVSVIARGAANIRNQRAVKKAEAGQVMDIERKGKVARFKSYVTDNGKKLWQFTDFFRKKDKPVMESAGKKTKIKLKNKTFKLQDRYQFQGLPISVENKKGSYRKGEDGDGHEWRTFMHFDYGYIRSTKGADDEGIDVYVGPDRTAKHVYVVKQHDIVKVKAWGSEYCPICKEHAHDCECSEFYDEDKVFVGFSSKKDAREAYLKQYDSPLFLGPISTLTIEELQSIAGGTKKKHQKNIPLKHACASEILEDAGNRQTSLPLTRIEAAKTIGELSRIVIDFLEQEKNVPAEKITGDKGVTYLFDNTEVHFRYEVREADALITSHDDQLRINEAFPQERQPRDRARSAMQLQIVKMANNLNPIRLGESASASAGAPIIDQNGIVESGNGRTIAIKRAYSDGKGKGDEYKAWTIQNAEEFGVNPDHVRRMKRPVVVRVRTPDMDAEDFARKANQGEIAQMSPAELARADAERITDADMLSFRPTKDGYLGGRDNQPFINKFVNELGLTESAGYITSTGGFTRQLLERVNAAIFQKAYNDDSLVQMMIEEAHPAIRNIITSLTVASGAFAKAKGVDANLGGINIPDFVVGAAKLIKRSRDTDMPLESILNQQALFGGQSSFDETIPPEVAKMALFFNDKKNIRSAKRMGMVLKFAAEKLTETLKNDFQKTLIGDPPPKYTASEIVDMAIAKMQEALDPDSKQKGLFESADDIREKAALRFGVFEGIMTDAVSCANQDSDGGEEDAINWKVETE